VFNNLISTGIVGDAKEYDFEINATDLIGLQEGCGAEVDHQTRWL